MEREDDMKFKFDDAEEVNVNNIKTMWEQQLPSTTNLKKSFYHMTCSRLRNIKKHFMKSKKS